MTVDLHVTPRALEDLAAKILVAAEGVIKALKDAAALAGAPVKLVEHFISTAAPRAAASAMNSPSP